MDSLVFKGNNGQVVTNSLLVAEKFGKRHADVIRSIENLLKSSDEELNAKMRLAFVSNTYEDSTGKSNPVYIMNRKGLSILVMGYNGIKALRFKNDFYDAFEEMEKALKEQSKPLSSAQMFAMQANINLEYENRISNVEKRIEAIEQEREENGKLLLAIPVSTEKIPEMSLRDKIRQMVNRYSSAQNVKQQDVWRKIYDQLYYLYHISIRSYKKKNGESNLDIAEKHRFIEYIYNIISNMIREKGVA